MADKRISQLIERTDIANNDVLPIVASGATTTNKVTISTIQDWMQDNLDVGVTSVGITLGTSGTDVNVSGSPITTSGNITINIPDASATARGVVSTGTQTFAGAKTFNSDIIVNGVNVGRGGSSVPSNTRVGNSALQDNTTGGNNTAVGFASLIFTTTGSSNTAIGHQVLSNNNGSLNTGVGISSLFNLTTGSNNLGLGNQAGNQISGGANHTTSNNSIFIGSDTKPAANNQTNQIVIGHQSVGQGSNTVTIGNSDITSNKLFGRVIHADAVNADESATLGQVSTSLGGYVTLGTAQTITGSKTFNSRIIGQDASLTGSGSADTLEVTHTSGSGIAVDISKAGNGEGLRVTKTSGSGNAVTISGGALVGETGLFSGDLQSGTRLIAAASSQSIILTPNSGGTTNRVESVGTLPLALVSAAAITMAAGGTTPQITLATTGAATFTGDVSLSGASGNRSLNITSNTSGNPTINLIAAGVDSATISYNRATSELNFANSGASSALKIASTGAATFSSSVTATGSGSSSGLIINNASGSPQNYIDFTAGATVLGRISRGNTASGLETNGLNIDNFSGFKVRLNQLGGSGGSFTIDGGNVGIGTASPSQSLNVVGNGRFEASSGNRYIEVASSTSSIQFGTDGSSQFIYGVGSFPMTFSTNATERMRITSGGFLKASNTGSYIGATGNYHEIRSNQADQWATLMSNSSSSPYVLNIRHSNASPNNADNWFIFCEDSTSARFRVASNGNVTNINGSYGSISDAKLKENITDASPKLEDLLKVKVRNYNLIGEETKQIGVIAQELEEVFPAMIDESEDFEEVEVPVLDEEGNEVLNEEGEVVSTKEKQPTGTTTKSVKYSVFVPMLIKAIQEQQEIINEMRAEIDSLKTK